MRLWQPKGCVTALVVLALYRGGERKEAVNQNGNSTIGRERKAKTLQSTSPKGRERRTTYDHSLCRNRNFRSDCGVCNGDVCWIKDFSILDSVIYFTSVPPHSTTVNPFLAKDSSFCGTISIGFSSALKTIKTRSIEAGFGSISRGAISVYSLPAK